MHSVCACFALRCPRAAPCAQENVPDTDGYRLVYTATRCYRRTTKPEDDHALLQIVTDCYALLQEDDPDSEPEEDDFSPPDGYPKLDDDGSGNTTQQVKATRRA